MLIIKSVGVVKLVVVKIQDLLNGLDDVVSQCNYLTVFVFAVHEKIMILIGFLQS
jgi:hypothetical protein